MSNYDLGTATGTVKINYDGDGVTKGQQGLKTLEGSADKSSAAVGKVGTATGVAGLAIVAGLGVAVNTAANFEKGLSAIKAVSGATAPEMDKIRDAALRIGKDTAFSASEAATAMEELSKAGISTTDILGGAADATVALAAAGEVDLPVAATIASNAMNQFQLAAKDLPHVADLLAGAANASAISVTDLGESLNYVGPVANALGVSIDDASAAIAVLGNQGIKGSSAGTALRSILTNLSPSTKKATQAFKELGLITKDGSNQFFTATGELKPLNQVVGILNGSLKGLTAEQKNAFAKKAFGLESLAAVSVLAGTTSAEFDKMTGSIAKIKAADVAKTRLDNVKGSVEQLKGSAETLGIQLGTVLIPIVKQIVDALTGILNVFLNLSPGMQKFIVVAAATAAGLLLAVAAVIKITQAVQAFRAVMVALNTTFLANPIFLVIAAIVALIVILVVAYKNSETFRNIVNAVWGAIKTAIGAVVDWITGTAVPFIINAWNMISGGAQALWGKIVSIFNAVKAFLTLVFSAIVTVITTYVNIWKTIITTVLNVILGIWNAVWGLFGPVITSVFGLIKDIITLAMKLIFFVIGLQIRAILLVWKTVWNAIKAVVSAIWPPIKTTVSAAINFIKNVITTVFNAIKSFIRTVVNGWKFLITTAWNAVKGPVSAAVNFLRSVITGAFNAINSVVISKVAAVVRTISSIRSKVFSVFSGAASWLTDAGRRIISGLLSGITSRIEAVRSKLRELTNLIPDWKGPAKTDKELLVQNGEFVMGGFIKGIESMFRPLQNVLGGVTTNLPASLGTPSALAAVLPAQRTAAQAGQPVAAQRVYNTNIYNPLPERSGDSVNKRLSSIALAGI